MVIAFWIFVAAVCLGLCVYGINTAIRRAREQGRRDQDVHTLTRQ